MIKNLKMQEEKFIGILPSNNFNFIDNSFKEIGASGKIYDKQDAVDCLTNKKEILERINWFFEKFEITQISENIILVNYILHQKIDEGWRKSYRLSIWKNNFIFYHQGTLINL